MWKTRTLISCPSKIDLKWFYGYLYEIYFKLDVLYKNVQLIVIYKLISFLKWVVFKQSKTGFE